VRSLDAVAQGLLPPLTVVGMFLLARRNRWGCVVALAAQPLWALTYLVHGQPGGLVTVALVTVSLVAGGRRSFRPGGPATAAVGGAGARR
jgi:hypothetical protein